jgi:hypothetical protein
MLALAKERDAAIDLRAGSAGASCGRLRTGTPLGNVSDAPPKAPGDAAGAGALCGTDERTVGSPRMLAMSLCR